MAKNLEKETINLGKEELIFGDVLKVLLKIKSSDVNEFFTKSNISFGRELRIHVLKETFKEPVILTKQERNTLADEMNYRLTWFYQYSETQLINLFKFYNDKKLEKAFLESLWYEILRDLNNKNFSKKDFDKLLALSDKKNPTEDIIKYNLNLNGIFFDEEGKLDGLTPKDLRPTLYKSSTIVEIRELGKKYGVNVPARLRKAELLAIIIEELRDKGQYSPELEENLNQLNILLLQRFAKDNDIKASTELKKEEVIEYVLKNAHQTKEAYFAPEEDVYEKEAHDLGETIEAEVPEVVEEVKEEPEVVEEVKEEPEVVEEEDEDEEEEPAAPEVVLVPARDEFDPSTVDGTVLDTLTFGKLKPKQFVEIASLERGFHDNQSEVQTSSAHDDVYKVQIIPKKKKRSLFAKIIRIIFIVLIVVVNLAILLGLYAIFTPNGVAALKGVEDFIANLIGFDFFDWIRTQVNAIL